MLHNDESVNEKEAQLQSDFSKLPRKKRRDRKTLDDYRQKRTSAKSTLSLLKELGG
jgi:hypothetical protein